MLFNFGKCKCIHTGHGNRAGVNSLDEMVSPGLTPLMILIFSLSLSRCRATVTELSMYMSFRISMRTYRLFHNV